jgi:DNA-3-methyladenine glycosylase
MFEAGGAIYVYLSYGVHHCVNIVTGPLGEGQAVLIRALEPTTGLEDMAARRHTSSPRLLTSGPGRLSQALGLKLSDSGSHLGETLSLRPAGPYPAQALAVATSPRIGITKATDYPWRFFLRDNPFVSRPQHAKRRPGK